LSDDQDSVEVSVDADVCVGIGSCISAEPDVFELLDEGYSRALPGVRLPRDRAERVIADCPSGAISVAPGGGAGEP
jgi:ferredoxin